MRHQAAKPNNFPRRSLSLRSLRYFGQQNLQHHLGPNVLQVERFTSKQKSHLTLTLSKCLHRFFHWLAIPNPTSKKPLFAEITLNLSRFWSILPHDRRIQPTTCRTPLSRVMCQIPMTSASTYKCSMAACPHLNSSMGHIII